jgi:hypothetical protein
MANLTPSLLYIGADTSANVVTVSNNTGSYAIIKNINLCNFTPTAATCSLHLLVSGVSAASNNNAILKSFTVAPNETVAYNGIVVMPTNSNLYLSQAPFSSITLSISGVRYAT